MPVNIHYAKQIQEITDAVNTQVAQRTSILEQGAKDVVRHLEHISYAYTDKVLITWPYSDKGKNKIEGQYMTVVGPHDLFDKSRRKSDINKLIRLLGGYTPCVIIQFPNNTHFEVIHNDEGIIDISSPERSRYGITPNSRIVTDPAPILQRLTEINVDNIDISQYLENAGLLKVPCGK